MRDVLSFCRPLAVWFLKSAAPFPVLQAAHRLGAGGNPGTQAGGKSAGWDGPWCTVQIKAGCERGSLVPGLYISGSLQGSVFHWTRQPVVPVEYSAHTAWSLRVFPEHSTRAGSPAVLRVQLSRKLRVPCCRDGKPRLMDSRSHTKYRVIMQRKCANSVAELRQTSGWMSSSFCIMQEALWPKYLQSLSTLEDPMHERT